jgi:hypothetical protein
VCVLNFCQSGTIMWNHVCNSFLTSLYFPIQFYIDLTVCQSMHNLSSECFGYPTHLVIILFFDYCKFTLCSCFPFLKVLLFCTFICGLWSGWHLSILLVPSHVLIPIVSFRALLLTPLLSCRYHWSILFLIHTHFV